VTATPDDTRILIGTDSFEAVAFKVPVAEFHNASSLARRPAFNRLGQDVLAEDFDEQRAVEQFRIKGDVDLGERSWINRYSQESGTSSSQRSLSRSASILSGVSRR
jgi:hypothetical protein